MSLAIRQRHGQNYYYFRKGAKKILYLGPVDRPAEVKQERVIEALEYTWGLDSRNVKLEYHLMELLSPTIRDEYLFKRLIELDKDQNEPMMGLLSEAKQKEYLELRIAELQTRLRLKKQEVSQIEDHGSGLSSLIEHGQDSLAKDEEIKKKADILTNELRNAQGLQDEFELEVVNIDDKPTFHLAKKPKSDRRSDAILKSIRQICTRLSLPEWIIVQAESHFKRFDAMSGRKWKSHTLLAVATVYFVCKMNSIVKSLEEITEAAGISPKDAESVKLASKYYRIMAMEMDYPILAKFPPKMNTGEIILRLIALISERMNIEFKVTRFATDLATKTMQEQIIQGKDPKSTAAAYVLIASTLLGQNLLQRDVAELLSVKQSTIRERIKEIVSNHKFTITVGETLHSPLYGRTDAGSESENKNNEVNIEEKHQKAD